MVTYFQYQFHVNHCVGKSLCKKIYVLDGFARITVIEKKNRYMHLHFVYIYFRIVQSCSIKFNLSK